MLFRSTVKNPSKLTPPFFDPKFFAVRSAKALNIGECMRIRFSVLSIAMSTSRFSGFAIKWNKVHVLYFSVTDDSKKILKSRSLFIWPNTV